MKDAVAFRFNHNIRDLCPEYSPPISRGSSVSPSKHRPHAGEEGLLGK
jgi:hypothetical protein